jgi:C-terminal processing protease CtpA/Prc
VKAGRYKDMSVEKFKDALTNDLRQTAGDVHLFVWNDPKAPQEASPPLPRVRPKLVGPVPVEKSEIRQASQIPREMAEFAKAGNFGIVGFKILPGNVGLLEIDSFPPFTQEVADRYRAAFTLIRDTNALVIDVSDHGGGDGMTAGHLASYLLQRKPFVFNRILERNASTEETWTEEIPAEYLYGEMRPVLVVTNKNTVSAGESFVYGLKALGRATFVGEKTAGGANPGRAFPIGYGYMAFVARGRAENPITKSNWDGVGISPDVAVAPAEAVKTAHRLALEAVAKASTTQKEHVEKALQLLSKDTPKLD